MMQRFLAVLVFGLLLAVPVGASGEAPTTSTGGEAPPAMARDLGQPAEVPIEPARLEPPRRCVAAARTGLTDLQLQPTDRLTGVDRRSSVGASRDPSLHLLLCVLLH